MALNGPRSCDKQCPLMGMKLTQSGHRATSDADPKQTLNLAARASSHITRSIFLPRALQRYRAKSSPAEKITTAEEFSAQEKAQGTGQEPSKESH